VDWEEGRKTEPTNLDAVGLAETLDEFHGQPLARLRHRFRLSRRVSPDPHAEPRMRAGGDFAGGGRRKRSERRDAVSSAPTGSRRNQIRCLTAGCRALVDLQTNGDLLPSPLAYGVAQQNKFGPLFPYFFRQSCGSRRLHHPPSAQRQ
jgi:hypothetical protein